MVRSGFRTDENQVLKSPSLNGSLNSSDDAFVPNIDDINDIEDELVPSRKTASVWNYINCKDPSHPGVPVCKTCGYLLSQETLVLNRIFQANTV
jgi:hypothetical protein